MRTVIIGVFSLLLAASPYYASAQNTRKIEKREKELEKTQQEQEAEEAAFVEQAKRNHLSIQEKKTKKRMKKSAKKASCTILLLSDLYILRSI